MSPRLSILIIIFFGIMAVKKAHAGPAHLDVYVAFVPAFSAAEVVAKKDLKALVNQRANAYCKQVSYDYDGKLFYSRATASELMTSNIEVILDNSTGAIEVTSTTQAPQGQSNQSPSQPVLMPEDRKDVPHQYLFDDVQSAPAAPIQVTTHFTVEINTSAMVQGAVFSTIDCEK